MILQDVEFHTLLLPARWKSSLLTRGASVTYEHDAPIYTVIEEIVERSGRARAIGGGLEGRPGLLDEWKLLGIRMRSSNGVRGCKAVAGRRRRNVYPNATSRDL